MTKQLSVMPIATEQIREMILEEGNTKRFFVATVRTFGKKFQREYPKMSRKECMNESYELVVNAYSVLGIKVPY